MHSVAHITIVFMVLPAFVCGLTGADTGAVTGAETGGTAGTAVGAMGRDIWQAYPALLCAAEGVALWVS